MPMLSYIVDIIILLGALAVAITNLYKFFAKPTSHFKKKAEEAEKIRIKQVLDETLPKVLYDHDLETRKKYLSDRQNYLEEIKEEVLHDIGGTIKEILDLNLEQNKKIETLARSSRDILREKIMAIYFRNKRIKAMSYYEREALEQYYKDYKAEGGNSYIDKYYSRMCLWETIDSDEYDEN